MTRRDVLRLSPAVVLGPSLALAAPCQSDLDPRTVSDYDAYLSKARAAAETALPPAMLERVFAEDRTEALKALDANQPYVWNLHQKDPNGALAVHKGIIVDWMGAARIRNTSLDNFQRVLQQYDSYKKWYKPYIYDAYARPIEGPGFKDYAVTSIVHDVVVEKPANLHFSFEIMAESNYFTFGSGDARTLVIRTHAKSIREAASGHPERADSRAKENDLLPVGHGQGVLWRSDTWWRAKQVGPDVYAEYESLSLARSLDAVEFFSLCSVLRLPGLRGKVLESMRVRPRQTVTNVVRSTKAACEAYQTSAGTL